MASSPKDQMCIRDSTYTLEGSRLTKAHRVENRSAVPMLYELGGHDGFRTPLEPGETMADYAGLLYTSRCV